jgi:hypothetical protein
VDGVNLPSEEPSVRQIKFDAIPSSLVESVQVSKTLQANLEGDGIGGSVSQYDIPVDAPPPCCVEEGHEAGR